MYTVVRTVGWVVSGTKAHLVQRPLSALFPLMEERDEYQN